MGGGEYADIISFHGYCNTEAESVVSVISRYQKVRRRRTVRNSKPLWDTEADWAGDADDVLEGSGNRAAFMAKYYFLHWSAGVSRFVGTRTMAAPGAACGVRPLALIRMLHRMASSNNG